MLFSEPVFIFGFLPIVAGVYFVIIDRLGLRSAMAWLVLASLFFYAWWRPAYLVLILASLIFNYAVARRLGRSPGSVAARRLLVLGVASNLVLLGYFKYWAFFAETANLLAGTNFTFERLILPLAISFFTFQQIAYLVDAYRGDTEQYGLLEYVFFVTFFPQLIAGPIVLHREILPQFREAQERAKLNDVAVGLTIFLIGLFKKVLIADTVAAFASPVFDVAASGGALTFFDAWTGALAFTVQLYFDFSGYSDMAVGLARIFGIRLPINFNSPYKAASIIDFWRRWHITLSRFLRDYVYIPLGGNRQGPVRRHANLLITMLLGGLWHGAGWTFVVWGGLHGSYLIVNHAWRTMGGSAANAGPPVRWMVRLLSLNLTFVCVVVGWVFFRAESWDSSVRILRTMSGLEGISLPPGLRPHLAEMVVWMPDSVLLFNGLGPQTSLTTMLVIAVALGIAWLAPNTYEILADTEPVIERVRQARLGLRWQPRLIVGAALGIGLFIVVKGYFTSTPSEFLYFNF